MKKPAPSKIGLAVLTVEWTARGVLAPVMSLLLLEKGLSLGTLPVGMAIHSAVSLILEAPSGMLSDLFGRKRVFLAAQGVYLCALLSLFFGGGTLVVYGVLALYGTARALASGSLDALVLDAGLQEQGETGLRRLSVQRDIFTTAGAAFGALLGGVLHWAGGVSLALAGSLVLTLAALGSAALFTREIPLDSSGKAPTFREQSARLWNACKAQRQLPILLAASALTGALLLPLETYWQPRFTQLLNTKSLTWLLGVLNFGYFGASIGGSFLAGKALEKPFPTVPNRIRTLFPGKVQALFLLGSLCAGLSLVLLSFAGSALWFGAGYLLLYFFLGISDTARGVAVNRASPSAVRATLLSGQGLSLQLGGFLSSAAIGLTAGAFPITFLWLWVALLFLAGTGLTGLLLKHAQ